MPNTKYALRILKGEFEDLIRKEGYGRETKARRDVLDTVRAQISNSELRGDEPREALTRLRASLVSVGNSSIITDPERKKAYTDSVEMIDVFTAVYLDE